MIGGFADCCARVLSGQPATAPPRSVMNSGDTSTWRTPDEYVLLACFSSAFAFATSRAGTSGP